MKSHKALLKNLDARKYGLKQHQAWAVINDFFEEARKALMAHERIRIIGFGALIPVWKHPKKYWDFQTQSSQMSKGKWVVRFKESLILKGEINAANK